ncbi:MAG: hypothetical protein PVF66_05365 [Candidatus Aminicenantes bacterium]|jgi:hypothetical protein
MAFRIGNSSEGKRNLEKITRVLFLSILASLLVMAGSPACKKSVEEEVDSQEAAIEFEGVAKVGVGKYLYVPEAQGFDIIIQGQVESGDASVLVDKEVRGRGEFSPERASILVANSIDVKESGRNWRNVFTRTEDVVLDDYLEIKIRDEYEMLTGLSFDKKESWEGKERGKIHGRLFKETVTEGEEQKEIYKIVVLNEDNQEIGTILVDNMSNSALFYTKKLRLFERLWFYLTIKDTVAWRIRSQTSELFHADVLYAGLF